MATRYWLGRVQPRAQVVTVTVTAYDAATTYKITIGVNVVSVTGDTDTAGTAEALQAALAASEYREFQEISWTYPGSGAVITGTAQTAGKPFTATSSVSGGTGTIGAVTTTTTNTSPNDVADANNWSAATLPTTGDSIVIENGSTSLWWGLDALAAVDVASCIVRKSFTGDIGLPTVNTAGYVEYRETEFTLSTCTSLIVEQAASLAAGAQKFNVGANACALQVIGEGTSTTLGDEVMWFAGTSTSNTIENNGGSLAIAALDSDSAALTTLNCTAGSITRAGAGTTFSTATVKGTNSILDVRSNIATLTWDGASGSLMCWNTMTVTTLSLTSPCVYNSSGTIATLNLYNTENGDSAGVGSIDFSQDRSGVTITNAVNMHRGTTLNDPNGRVTLSGTPDIQLVQCRLADVSIDLGINRGLSIT